MASTIISSGIWEMVPKESVKETKQQFPISTASINPRDKSCLERHLPFLL